MCFFVKQLCLMAVLETQNSRKGHEIILKLFYKSQYTHLLSNLCTSGSPTRVPAEIYAFWDALSTSIALLDSSSSSHNSTIRHDGILKKASLALNPHEAPLKSALVKSAPAKLVAPRLVPLRLAPFN